MTPRQKITDKQRLNWVIENVGHMDVYELLDLNRGDIDRAIRAERRA